MHAASADALMTDSIAILDFGSQYAQLIARRLREAQVYCELFPWDAPAEVVMAMQPSGFILSGGPRSVYEPGAPIIQDYILESHLPILGICYGMQALTHAAGRPGGSIRPARVRACPHRACGGQPGGWPLAGVDVARRPHHAHAGRIHSAGAVRATARWRPSATCSAATLACSSTRRCITHRTASSCCATSPWRSAAAKPDWTPRSIIEEAVGRVRQQVGGDRVLAAVSGGVDSTVAAALVHRAIGDQLVTLFVDTGLLRQGERGAGHSSSAGATAG